MNLPSIHHEQKHAEKLIDLRLIADFAKIFTVLLRHARNYPKGHPIIETFVGRAIEAYRRMMGTAERISLGMTKDTLMLEDVTLEKSNVFFRDFAHNFFSRGIGAVIFSPGLTADEVRRILLIFRVNQEGLKGHGGIEEVWKKARIKSIEIRGLRFELFTTTENGLTVKVYGELLWERLVRGLLKESLNPDGTPRMEIDPEILADIFNGKYAETGSIIDGGEMMNLIVQEEQAMDAGANPVFYKKLAAFVSRLEPSLRHRFLCASAEVGRPDGAMPIADLIGAIDPEAVLNIMENGGNMKVPPLLMQIVQKLASQAPPDMHGSYLSAKAAKETISNLFREHALEQYVPAEYQRKLQSLIAFHGVERPPDELGELLDSLDEHKVQHVLGEIILQFAGQGGDERELVVLSQNMEEMCLYLLQTGEYHEVLSIIRRTMDPVFPAAFRERFFRTVSRPEFLEEVINGVKIWGKSRYDDISALIRAIGAPFVEPLLGRLAVEEKISFRRFFIDRLADLGPSARNSLLARLGDTRWYFVRNILTILRLMNDPSVAAHLRPLLKHSNQIICQEALRTLQHFGDPAADRQIAGGLDSGDRKVQLAAITHARKSRSPEVFRSLLAIVVRTGLSPADIELRCAAVQALGEMGNPAALDKLAKVLASSTLIRSKGLMRLKEEIVRSMILYPPEAALPVLYPLLQNTDSVGRAAAEIEKTVKAGKHER